MRRSALLVLVMLAACSRSTSYGPHPGPCVFDSDCPPALHCVDQQCIILGVYDAGGPGLKRFGEPCDAGVPGDVSPECESGLCLPGPPGGFCSLMCTGSCPDVTVCKTWPPFRIGPLPDGGMPPLTYACAIAQPLLCQPCVRDEDCGATWADKCLRQGDAGFCGMDCTFTPCPEGYACQSDHQCHTLTSCDCTSRTLGEIRGCRVSDSVGTCYAAQTCTATGWSQCPARLATPEVCNGIDDDCNGLIDDGISPRPCHHSDGGHTCQGTETCMGSLGWSCDAKWPVPEACNDVDDDCDGVVDNGFVDDAGRYITRADCGGCGHDCNQLVHFATATSCVLDATGQPTCVATACQTGYFLYADAGACIGLEDSLCRSCAVDSDCVGPGSQCLQVGREQVCGRDCSLGSPYGPCPFGYVCTATGGVMQCVPSNGTCACTAAALGTRRACSKETCRGFQFCALDGGPNWSACDVKTYNPEICDGIDNDCDGVVDEGFLDPDSGKYDLSVQNCGFCNNDCTKYWSADLQHTTGNCDTAPAVPVCVMGACFTAMDGGVAYEWVDVDGSDAGCLCERVRGNTTIDPPKLQPPYTDENCDGIDGVVGNAIFVWAGAAPGGNGSLQAPFRTIGQGLAALAGSPAKQYVLVAQGEYLENVVLFSGAQLFGAYSPDFHSRDTVVHASIIQGQAPLSGASGGIAAIHAQNIVAAAQPTIVSGFSLFGYDVSASTPDDKDGQPTYTVYINNAGSGLVLANNELVAGRGGGGGQGSTGAQGFGAQASTALNGQSGLSSGRAPGPCPSGLSNAGGAAGNNAACPASSSQPGGSVVCPVFNWSASPVQGNEQPYTSSAFGNGVGGWDWSFDSESAADCHHVTESGFPVLHQSHDGRNGAQGADGKGGTGGQGARALGRTGSVAGGQWVPSPFSAGVGVAGSNAAAGGGGGAGGGTFYNPGGGCGDYEFGATGGGGGAGGCSGAGGAPGRSGGASIAILAVYSATPAALPQIANNQIGRQFGGSGGNGGFGGAGGLGGNGGFGGTPTTWSSSTAGTGGAGGNGGPGGGGGGGAGGPSFGILAFNADASAWATQNTFTTGSAANTAGQGGLGGSSAGAGTGTAGAVGSFADVLSLVACGTGCPSGTTCDANSVCVPN